MRPVFAMLAACLAAPLAAETPLDAEAFDALTRGRTFQYLENGLPYGVEEYRPGRRVRWSYLGGACLEGEWFQAGDMICFRYEGRDDLQCWTFRLTSGRLTARFMDAAPGDALVGVERTEDLVCPGPEVGV